VEGSWSRKLLEHHLATGRYEREGRALTNFAQTLPGAEGELVQRIVHEDYSLGFLGLDGEVRERRLERSLVEDIERFMLELGSGFAFVGRQVALEVDAGGACPGGPARAAARARADQRGGAANPRAAGGGRGGGRGGRQDEGDRFSAGAI
jgi:hypothetical protein